MSNMLPVELEAQQWNHLDRVLFRNSPLAHEYFSPDEETKDFLQNHCKVLVVGAGELGCEVIKNLVMSGFRHVDVIDMDTINQNNLHTYSLFKHADLGKPKSKVVADYFNKRVPGVNITPHYAIVQDLGPDFLRFFNIILCVTNHPGTPRWINSELVRLVDTDTSIPFIVGTTNGFRGTATLITPGQSSCYECMLHYTYPRSITLDTLVCSPRQPEHCIGYAIEVQWNQPEHKKVTVNEQVHEIDKKEQFDRDNEIHVMWIYEQARERAAKLGIRGVTYHSTVSFVQNTTPVYIGTHAVVASICANEALKVATLLSKSMNNNLEYNGNEGIVSHTLSKRRLANCKVCGPQTSCYDMTVTPYMTVKEWRDCLVTDHPFLFKNPTIRFQEKAVYVSNIKSMEEQTRHNLERSMIEIIPDGTKVRVSESRYEVDNLIEVVVHYQHFGYLGSFLTRNNFSDLLINYVS